MRQTLIILAFLLLLPACSGQWSHYPRSEVVADHGTYQIETGDTLNISVFGEEALSGDYKVLKDGTIQVPLIGAVAVEKQSLEQANILLTEKFKKQGYLVNPKITLSIAQARTVKIMGEVLGAGEYPYSDDMTVLGLVAKAGGFSYRANQNRFDIVRKQDDGTSEKVIEAALSTRVMPGDIVRVKERFF